MKVTDDWLIRPIDGFGDKNLLRMLLATERPDALFIFTDPRFFGHVFDMEDEIHTICPIIYSHLWDNSPFPEYNVPMYECIDQLNCISHHTYTQVKNRFPDSENIEWIPHTLPVELFQPLDDTTISQARQSILGQEKKDWFVGLWVGRNARRKMPADILHSWYLFLDQLEQKYGHRNAALIMHTDPLDQEGPNLYKVVELYGLTNNVIFSTDRIEFHQMNLLHNIADFGLNISSAEGFGLPILESLMTATPVIVLKTGGMTKQVTHDDGSYNGIGLDPDAQCLVGTQYIPYIFEDHVNNQKVGDAILELYEWGPQKRKVVGMKALEYARRVFSYSKMISDTDRTITNCIDNWKKKRKSWKCREL